MSEEAGRRGLAIGVLLTGVAMVMLDVTIVNVSLTSIRRSIGADESTLSWIISGYTLATGLSLIPAGRLGDRFGHRRVFLVGVVAFTLASLWCGLAPDGTQLVVARVVQGLGGGLFFPAVTAFIQLLRQGRARGRAFALMGAVMGVSMAVGPLLGGLLIEGIGTADGWRWIFFVNIPIGLVCVVLAAIVLPPGRVAGAARGLDAFGLALLTAGILAILVPLIEGEQAGWPAWTWLSIAGGVVLLVAFGAWERRVVGRGGNPLVPPRLFVHRSFTAGLVCGVTFFAGFTGVFFVLQLTWQSGLGHGPLDAGMLTIPFSIASIVGSAFSERLAHALGRGALAIGMSGMVVGLAALAAIFALVPSPTVWELAAPLTVMGAGSALFIGPNTQFIVATVDPVEAGAASGVVTTTQRVGSAAGIAVLGSVMFGVVGAAGDWSAAASTAFGIAGVFAVLALGLVFTLPRHGRASVQPG